MVSGNESVRAPQQGQRNEASLMLPYQTQKRGRGFTQQGLRFRQAHTGITGALEGELTDEKQSYGTKTLSRTCHWVLLPGASVTISVSILPHSLPKGSAKLNWCSTAIKFFAGGA